METMTKELAGTTKQVADGEETVVFQPTYFEGHCLYVRRCKSPERTGLIWHTEGHVDTSYWVEVLARGPAVGKPCSKRHAELFERARYYGDGPDIGTLVLIPYNTHIGIKDSPFQEYEKFVEESLAVAYFVPEGD
jgi:hypothetical protein